MIKLIDSRITDILPYSLSSQPMVQGIAYTLWRQIRLLCQYASGIGLYASLDTVPEKALDVLAAELRTPAYDDSFPVSVKRTLIKETLTFYTKMGTPQAVNKIIEAVFQNGHIAEWFEYGGDPFHFKAYTTNPAISQSDVDEFNRVLSTVKRLSAWLDEIVLQLSAETMESRLGIWMHCGELVRLNPIIP